MILIEMFRTISRAKDDIMPELTKTFFEKILRDTEQRKDLQVDELALTSRFLSQVVKVRVRDESEIGRHFCSEVSLL